MPCRSFALFCAATFALVASSLGAQSPKLIIRNARIMTMAGGYDAPQVPVRGYLTVASDGTIVTVAEGEPPVSLHAAKVVDALGDYVIPGFISAHSHLWQAAYRGLAANQTLDGWIDDLYGVHAVKAAPEDIYWFTLYGSLDHLEHGVTSAFDFTYSPRTFDARALQFEQQQFRAESDSGIRFVHSYSPGRIGPTLTPEAAANRLKAFLDWTLTQPGSPNYLSTMISGTTAFNNTQQQAVFEAAMMKKYNLGNETHYLEPPEDQGEQRTKFRWMLDSGLITDKLIFGHFIHTDDFILQQTAAAHASMSWQPLSNGRLASGTADIPKYLKMGVRVGMGVDGEASADLADPFENMRTGLYAIRDKYESATVMSPYQVLWLHTRGSANVLGVESRLGSLEPGKYADLLLINPARLGAVLEDPYANLVFVAAERDIDSVYVGGELMVEHNQLLRNDLKKVQMESDRRVMALH